MHTPKAITENASAASAPKLEPVEEIVQSEQAAEDNQHEEVAQTARPLVQFKARHGDKIKFPGPCYWLDDDQRKAKTDIVLLVDKGWELKVGDDAYVPSTQQNMTFVQCRVYIKTNNSGREIHFLFWSKDSQRILSLHSVDFDRPAPTESSATGHYGHAYV